MKKISESTIVEKDVDEYNKGFECGKQRVLKYPEDFNLCEKSTWSEEDEEMFDAIIVDIQFTQKAHTHDINQIVYEREIDWLKSLKERVQPQPKQEWSEEDEMMLECVLDKIGDLGTGEMCKEWLKSLKERMKGE